ncbi:hypothetical protein [Halovenus salina]|uniref:Uncharacterized protein n=1 Tax=Halovenus salina TaxID=1510225 RepID=A0ABD5W5I1_9EURY
MGTFSRTAVASAISTSADFTVDHEWTSPPWRWAKASAAEAVENGTTISLTVVRALLL